MRRPVIYLMLAGVAAVLAATVVFSALKRREAEVQRAKAESVEIVVAAHDIPLGAKLGPDSLKLLRWSRDSIPPGAFTDPQALVGAFAKGQYFTNEPFIANKLFMGDKAGGVMPLLIPPGMRAMSVPVDEVADIAGFVQPHTRVDVLVAVSGGSADQPSFSRIVLQNVEVLAVAQEIERTKDEPQVVKVVTMLVTPEEAEKLSLASHEGTLRLAMRGYTDTKTVATSGVDIRDLLRGGSGQIPVMQVQRPAAAPISAHKVAAGPAPLTVEVLRDGQNAESVSFVNPAAAGRYVVPKAVGLPEHPPAMIAPPSPAPEASSSTSPAAPETAGAPGAPMGAASLVDGSGVPASSPGANPEPKTIRIAVP